MVVMAVLSVKQWLDDPVDVIPGRGRPLAAESGL
jgi:hypothetical protein